MMCAVLRAVLLTVLVCGCGDSRRVKELAGTYVTEHNEGDAVHSRTALTLRTDNRWTVTSELVINGQDMLAGGRIGDQIAPPGYADSGTFALKGVILSVNSQKDGVTQYVVSGDTLWMHNARMAAAGEAVTGMKAQGGPEGFLVRQR